MIPPPPRSTRTDQLFPYATLFRSVYLKQQSEAPGPLDREAVVIVPRGAGLSAIADDLAAAGVISNPTVFALGVRLFADARALQAGEYAFAAESSMREAAALIASGRTVVHRLKIGRAHV